MKCNYTCRQMNKLVKDPESGQYVLRHPEKGSKNCVERARAAWLAKAASPYKTVHKNATILLGQETSFNYNRTQSTIHLYN